MSGKRRALLLTMDFPPSRGGIQTMAREILQRADRFDFRVIAPAEPESASFDAALGVPVRRVRGIAPGKRGFVPGMVLATRSEIARQRPDVVLALHALTAMVPLRAPVVLACHGGELRSRRIVRVARWAFPRADRVVANSRFTRTEAVALGADPLRIHVLPVGAPDPVDVPNSEIEALRAKIGGRFILSVARLEPHKGHDTLIRAFAALEGDTRLAIVGEGPARASLEALATEMGVRDRVVLAGGVSEQELPRYFAAAECFALLSRATSGAVEGGGIALLEACAYGLPVVAGASGGVPETIHDGETGLLVTAEDAVAAARALRRVLGDAALAEKLRKAGRALATGERSWAGFVNRMEQILEMAADRSPKAVR